MVVDECGHFFCKNEKMESETKERVRLRKWEKENEGERGSVSVCLPDCWCEPAS